MSSLTDTYMPLSSWRILLANIFQRFGQELVSLWRFNSVTARETTAHCPSAHWIRRQAMPLSYSEVESLFRLGRFEEIAAGSTTSLRELQKLPSCDHQLLIAEAMARTGRLESASQVARQILESTGVDSWTRKMRNDSGYGRPRPWSHRRGTTELAALTAFCEREWGHSRRLHGQRSRLFRIISERQPPEVVSPLLAEVRRLTTRAADPHLTALLHESVARQEAQVGNLEQARRHLRIAYSLLESHPNCVAATTLRNQRILH